MWRKVARQQSWGRQSKSWGQTWPSASHSSSDEKQGPTSKGICPLKNGVSHPGRTQANNQEVEPLAWEIMVNPHKRRQGKFHPHAFRQTKDAATSSTANTEQASMEESGSQFFSSTMRYIPNLTKQTVKSCRENKEKRLPGLHSYYRQFLDLQYNWSLKILLSWSVITQTQFSHRNQGYKLWISSWTIRPDILFSSKLPRFLHLVNYRWLIKQHWCI